MKQFCETSSIFELDNVKDETILRGFPDFRSWQQQLKDRITPQDNFFE